VAYIFVSRHLRNRAGGLYLTTWQSVIGVAFLVPLVILERSRWSPALLAEPTIWLNLLYLGIACSAVSYFLYLYALSSLGSVVVSSYINLVPVVGAVGGVAVLGERLSPVQVLGAVVVIAGVFLVNLPRRQGPVPPPKS
jgi:drug/metabolite transporter (DMT)-like permease